MCANLLNRAEIGVEPEPGDTNTSPIVFEVEFGRPKLFTADPFKASTYKLQLRIAAFRRSVRNSFLPTLLSIFAWSPAAPKNMVNKPLIVPSTCGTSLNR